MAGRSARLSVRARVTAGATIVIAIAVLAAALIANGLLRRALTDDVDASLESRLDRVSGFVVQGQLGTVAAFDLRNLAPMQVVGDQGRIIAATPGLPEGTRFDVIDRPAAGSETSGTVDGSRIGGRSGDDYRVVARTIGDAPSVTVYAVASLAPAQRAQAHLRLGMVIGLPLVVALAGWLIWLVTGRALASVDQMREEVDRIQATDMTRRVSPSGGDSEIDRLGTTLNHLLDRLQDAAERQQVFAASASHELRSPLSAIRTELEVGLAYPERADWPKVAADSLVEVDRLEALARDLRLLTAARSPAAATAEPCDVWAVVTDEIGRRQPQRGVRYVATGAGAQVAIDRTRAAQVVRNLFDNAERHAATTIAVDVAADGDTVTMTVANDGPPIPTALRERIFEPFTRLDEARSLDAGGSGLGLAIARTVVVAAGGTLVALDDDRGATFRTTLPVAPSA